MTTTREDVIRRGTNKAMKIIKEMEVSKDLDFVKEIVTITDKLILEINCHRNDEPFFENDLGMALDYEVYAIKNNEAIDCVTIDYIENAESDIEYLLNCYV